MLATETYRRILESEELLAYFKDDPAIERLWRLNETELQRLWGEPTDLDVIGADRFLDPETADRPDERLLTRA